MKVNSTDADADGAGGEERKIDRRDSASSPTYTTIFHLIISCDVTSTSSRGDAFGINKEWVQIHHREILAAEDYECNEFDATGCRPR